MILRSLIRPGECSFSKSVHLGITNFSLFFSSSFWESCRYYNLFQCSRHNLIKRWGAVNHESLIGLSKIKNSQDSCVSEIFIYFKSFQGISNCRSNLQIIWRRSLILVIFNSVFRLLQRLIWEYTLFYVHS